MRTSPVWLAVALLINVASAQLPALGIEIAKDEAQKMKTITCNELESKAITFDGQIVKLKFGYRDTAISKQADDSYTGMIQGYIETSRKKSVDSGWGMVNVAFSKDALAWFSKIPTNIDAHSVVVVIGKVEVPAGGSAARVTLLGREIRTDMKGAKIVW